MLSETIQEYADSKYLPAWKKLYSDWASRAQKLEACVAAARLHKDTAWEFDPEFPLDGLGSWAAVLKALKALEE